MDLAEKKRMAACWRGRRLRACTLLDDLHDVIEGLAGDDGSDLPPEGGLPHPPTLAQIRELQNTTANLLRTILLWNDGRVSPQELRRY